MPSYLETSYLSSRVCERVCAAGCVRAESAGLTLTHDFWLVKHPAKLNNDPANPGLLINNLANPGFQVPERFQNDSNQIGTDRTGIIPDGFQSTGIFKLLICKDKVLEMCPNSNIPAREGGGGPGSDFVVRHEAGPLLTPSTPLRITLPRIFSFLRFLAQHLPKTGALSLSWNPRISIYLIDL